MKSQTLLTFIAMMALAQLAACAWTKPKTIVNVGSGFSAEDIYTDPTTGITHFLYFHVLKDPVVTYVQLFPNQSIAFSKNFSMDNARYYADARILGQDDGKNIMVMLNAKKRNPAYVADVFYADSKDGGKTWSAFTAVPRTRMDDSVNRYSTAVIFIKETKRHFIFYQVSNDKIAYVSRAAGSTTFSREKIIYTDAGYKQLDGSLDATYSMQGNNPILHVFWINIDNKKNYIYYMNSPTNGASWSTAIQLNNEPTSSGMAMSLAGKPAVSNRTIMTYHKDGHDSPLRVQQSSNNGASWTQPANFLGRLQDLHSWNYKTNWMAMCGTKEKPWLVALSQTDQSYVVYAMWNLKTMVPKTIVHPFGGYERMDGVLVSCINKGSQLLITAIVQVQSKGVRSMIIAADTESLGAEEDQE